MASSSITTKVGPDGLTPVGNSGCPVLTALPLFTILFRDAHTVNSMERIQRPTESIWPVMVPAAGSAVLEKVP